MCHGQRMTTSSLLIVRDCTLCTALGGRGACSVPPMLVPLSAYWKSDRSGWKRNKCQGRLKTTNQTKQAPGSRGRGREGSPSGKESSPALFIIQG